MLLWTSYDKTLSGTPVATEDFVDFADNLTLKFHFDEVEAGEYLLYMENITGNPAEAVGYWGYAAARAHVRSYKNNAEYDFCPGVSLLYGQELADPFAPISEMDPYASAVTPTEGDLYPDGEMIEYKMNAAAKYGVQFKSSAAFGGCEVFIPTVPVGDNTLTLSLYSHHGAPPSLGGALPPHHRPRRPRHHRRLPGRALQRSHPRPRL